MFGILVIFPDPRRIVTGRIKDNQGTYLADVWVSMMSIGQGGGEGGHYGARTDANGNFSIVGPPSTTIRNVIASAWVNDTDYVSPSFNLIFPASGQTRNMGTITVSRSGIERKQQ
jgi:hypothetical protein